MASSAAASATSWGDTATLLGPAFLFLPELETFFDFVVCSWWSFELELPGVARARPSALRCSTTVGASDGGGAAVAAGGGRRRSGRRGRLGVGVLAVGGSRFPSAWSSGGVVEVSSSRRRFRTFLRWCSRFAASMSLPAIQACRFRRCDRPARRAVPRGRSGQPSAGKRRQDRAHSPSAGYGSTAA